MKKSTYLLRHPASIDFYYIFLLLIPLLGSPRRPLGKRIFFKKNEYLALLGVVNVVKKKGDDPILEEIRKNKSCIDLGLTSKYTTTQLINKCKKIRRDQLKK